MFFNIIFQVSFKDDDEILFPSITFCKSFMYKRTALIPQLKTGNISLKDVEEKFFESTFSRSELIGFLNMNTISGDNNYPCNILSGLHPGGPCTFPFVIPDCRLSVKLRQCSDNSTDRPVSYQTCKGGNIYLFLLITFLKHSWNCQE